MTDIFTKDKRSEIMRQVKPYGNKSTEVTLIKFFNEKGIHGWRRHYNVKGHPDFVFLDKRIAVFVDGCFWHGHRCRNIIPKDNYDFWDKKRERNIKHDAEVNALFKKRGWLVIRIWECELKKANENVLEEKTAVLLEKETFSG